MNFFIKLSDSDKMFIFALLLLLILVLVLVWYIGYTITRIMKKQGKKIESEVANVVLTRVIIDEKSFKKYARKKNWRIFYHKARFAALIMVISFLILVIRNCLNSWDYDVFNIDNGFGSLLFCWDFSDESCYSNFFGFTILSSWPPLINTPHFNIEAWASYIFVPGFTVGALWYLFEVQSLIARTIHISKLKESVFAKNLESFNQTDQLFNTNKSNNNQ